MLKQKRPRAPKCSFLLGTKLLLLLSLFWWSCRYKRSVLSQELVDKRQIRIVFFVGYFYRYQIISFSQERKREFSSCFEWRKMEGNEKKSLMDVKNSVNSKSHGRDPASSFHFQFWLLALSRALLADALKPSHRFVSFSRLNQFSTTKNAVDLLNCRRRPCRTEDSNKTCSCPVCACSQGPVECQAHFTTFFFENRTKQLIRCKISAQEVSFEW